MTEKESFYFPHDYNPLNDPKMSAMVAQHEATGYGMYWCIIEMMHQDREHRLPLKSYLYLAIANQMRVSAERVQNLITDCIKIYELFESDEKVFWSNRVLRNIEKRDEISRKRSESGKKGAIAKQEQAIAKQNEAKKRKEKEIKEDDEVPMSATDDKRAKIYEMFKHTTTWKEETISVEVGKFLNKYPELPVSKAGPLVNGWVMNYREDSKVKKMIL